MTDTVISIRKLSKKYNLGLIGTSTFYTDLKRWWARRSWKADPDLNIGEKSSEGETIWALKDVSFDLQQGEMIGIIGANGSGKSTLLKILSRVTAPTAGEVRARGRITSLLEVGTGFHPELTGRENIYLNGAILGMSRAEVHRKIDAIVDFSGVEKFIDTPVKRYSSGMYVRLAFAVAAHLDSEILIADEVLSVGDADFRRRSLGKMGTLSEAGRTVLFVSHNMTAVQNLCDRVVWLDHGVVVADGPSSEIVPNYWQAAMDTDLTERTWDDVSTAPGNEKVRLRRLFVHPCTGSKSSALVMDEEIEIGVEFWSLLPDQELSIVLRVVTTDGVVAFSTSTNHQSVLQGKRLASGLYFASCRIYANLLNSNQYRVVLQVIENQSRRIFKMDDALVFDVLDVSSRRGEYLGKRQGVVSPLLEWTLERKSGAPY